MPLFCRTAVLPLHLWQRRNTPAVAKPAVQEEFVRTLRDRLQSSSRIKQDNQTARKWDASDDEKLSPTDIEHAICLAMRRLGILSKRWDLAVLLGEDGKKDSGDSELIVFIKPS
jgi:hypothetical protein